LLSLKKESLDVLLDDFIEIKNQMMSIALEKRKYHRRLIIELLKKYKTDELVIPESTKFDNMNSTVKVDMRNYRSLVRNNCLTDMFRSDARILSVCNSRIALLRSKLLIFSRLQPKTNNHLRFQTLKPISPPPWQLLLLSRGIQLFLNPFSKQ
jgi:hypothetical protein